MKLVNYRCECGKEKEELFNDTEVQPDVLVDKCECGGVYSKYNFKRNIHRIYIADAHSGL